jgi:hypothetical protein
MFYKRPTQWQMLRRRRGLRTITAFLAGIHAANGIAHGVTPPKSSPARPGYQVQTVGSTGG